MLMDGAYAATTVSESVILDDGDGDPEGDGAYRKSEGINPHEGTVQVVAGHGGTKLGRSGSCPVMKRILVEHGSVIVDVVGDTLTATMLNLNGKTRDLFSIVKRGQATPAKMALPWQPPEYKKPTVEPRTPAAPAIDHKVLIPAQAEWQYLAGQHPRGHQWTSVDFDSSSWKVGRAGFGFGDTEFETELKGLRGQPAAAYLRKNFTIAQADKVTELGLHINYLDAFVAYINGREVARVGVGRSSGRNAQLLKPREDRGRVYVSLKDAYKFLLDGQNVLAIEAHAASSQPLDFCVDPVLLLED
jgi:hypothetical protein